MSTAAIIDRIDAAAAAGRGVRLTWEETDALRAVLELSEARTQAELLDRDGAEPIPHLLIAHDPVPTAELGCNPSPHVRCRSFLPARTDPDEGPVTVRPASSEREYRIPPPPEAA